MADPDSASASASNPTPSTAPGGATPSSASHLPPILSRLASDRAATASISTVNAVGVAGGSSAPATSATASLSKRDESMLRVVRRADSASSAAVTSASTTTSPTTTTAEASVASPHVAPASSVSSVSLPVRDGPPNPNVLGAAPPPPPPMPDEENNVPTAGGLTSQGLFNLPTDIGPAGPSSVATAPAAMMTTSSSSPQRQTQQPTLASRFLPTIPSASAQRAIVEARQAIDATIANLLDSQLQDRALLMHGNMRSIAGQQRDLGSAVVGLRKANDDLAHLVQETLVPLKEVGNVQNWTEMQHRSLSVVEETIRLVRERRERRERAAAERQARREARSAARLATGENDIGDESDSESDGSSCYSESYSSSYFSGRSHSGSRSRSRSHSRSRSYSRSGYGSPGRSRSVVDAQPTASQKSKGKGKLKMEDIVENVRARPSIAYRGKEMQGKAANKLSLGNTMDAAVDASSTKTLGQDKGKERAAEEGSAAKKSPVAPLQRTTDEVEAELQPVFGKSDENQLGEIITTGTTSVKKEDTKLDGVAQESRSEEEDTESKGMALQRLCGMLSTGEDGQSSAETDALPAFRCLAEGKAHEQHGPSETNLNMTFVEEEQPAEPEAGQTIVVESTPKNTANASDKHADIAADIPVEQLMTASTEQENAADAAPTEKSAGTESAQETSQTTATADTEHRVIEGPAAEEIGIRALPDTEVKGGESNCNGQEIPEAESLQAEKLRTEPGGQGLEAKEAKTEQTQKQEPEAGGPTEYVADDADSLAV